MEYNTCHFFIADNQNTVISWRTQVTSDREIRQFEYKQVNELFTTYSQLVVAWGKRIQTLNLPTISKEWHQVTFSWSESWDLKVYHNGILVSETGRAVERDYAEASATDGLLIVGNRNLSSDFKPTDNFQIYGVTMWPRIVSHAQIKEMVETGKYINLVFLLLS